MSKQSILKNLMNSDYKRPKKTQTDKYQSKSEMEKKLKNYERADNVDDIDYKTHVRYVTLDKNGKMVFRLGGILIKKDPKYVKLSNGTFQWSVQRYHYEPDDIEKKEVIFETVFFYHKTRKSKKIQIDELKLIIDEQDNEIENLKNENETLKKKYKKVYDKLQLAINQLKYYKS